VVPHRIAGDEEDVDQGQQAGHRSYERVALFGVRFDLLTPEDLRTWVRATLAGPAETRHIAFSNSEFVLEARRNGRLRRYLNACDLNLVDGVGVVYALRMVTGRRPRRLSGTVFVATMCEEAAAAGSRVFLFG
jgi:UDP-N-acetyl-D-mannosaminuronic acid transferase (WecB/TagA/CpsF family)